MLGVSSLQKMANADISLHEERPALRACVRE
jgi:hypothetical protein